MHFLSGRTGAVPGGGAVGDTVTTIILTHFPWALGYSPDKRPERARVGASSALSLARPGAGSGLHSGPLRVQPAPSSRPLRQASSPVMWISQNKPVPASRTTQAFKRNLC